MSPRRCKGVAELGGIAIDSVFDTNTTRAISQAGDDVREALGSILLMSRAPSVM